MRFRRPSVCRPGSSRCQSVRCTTTSVPFVEVTGLLQEQERTGMRGHPLHDRETATNRVQDAEPGLTTLSEVLDPKAPWPSICACSRCLPGIGARSKKSRYG